MAENNISTSIKEVNFDSVIAEFEKAEPKTESPSFTKNLEKENPVFDADYNFTNQNRAIDFFVGCNEVTMLACMAEASRARVLAGFLPIISPSQPLRTGQSLNK